MEKTENIVCVWNSEDVSKSGRKFETMEDAQAYIQKMDVVYRKHGMDPITSWATGSEDEYQKAVVKFEKELLKQQKQQFADSMEKECSRLAHMIGAMKGIQKVCDKFDGKVINKRFHDAIKAETGYDSVITCGSYFRITYYGREFDYNNRPEHHFYFANQYAKDNRWSWNTNDRLDAAAAKKVMQDVIDGFEAKIAFKRSQVDLFLDYKKKAEKLYKEIRELAQASYELRDFCKQNIFPSLYECQTIWR